MDDPDTRDVLNQNQTAFNIAEEEWTSSKQGPFTVNGAVNLVGWSRMFPMLLLSCQLTRDVGTPLHELDGAQDPSSGPLSPHVETLYTHSANARLEPAPTT